VESYHLAVVRADRHVYHAGDWRAVLAHTPGTGPLAGRDTRSDRVRRIVVGVDGGGSRTRAVVADESGAPVGSAEGGPSAVRPGDVEKSASAIASVVADALAVADHGDTAPSVLSVGVAGVGREPERHALERALVSRGLADEIVVQPDAM